ncbi:hypothetical protein MF271_17070 (plasmid) [Deinococcus sp. KNUC1210]|uniref:hypothetical protein n=1 Tax=Deinococcus sp. KNUC1210 TaxID=2917691 RepID=UPI001EEFD5B8|nr:hypothetical protein [Deinococcus sp. KNUC1210]ULH17036.1 hypothetical protein MF271_17070 [Deinococcus sp. KNUC1210]
MNNSVLRAALAVLPLAFPLQASAGEVKLDTLLVSGGTSPCLAVRVNILQNGVSLSQLNLRPNGTLNVQKGALVHFQKGQTYLLQATCISGGSFTQNSGLTFLANGRTIIVQFTPAGFQVKRGGLAY